MSDEPDDLWQRLDNLPSMSDEPVVWDPQTSSFVPASQISARQRAASAPRPDPQGDLRAARPRQPGREPNRHVVVEPGAPDALRDRPPRAQGPRPAGQRPPGQRPPGPRPPGQRPPGPRPPGQRPPGEPVPANRRKVVLAGNYKHRRRLLPWPLRWLRRIVVGWLVLAVLVGGGLLVFGWTQFNKIPKASVASALSPPSGTGTNFLFVGTDSRDGIDVTDPNAQAFLGPGEPAGSTRTDTILVLRVEPERKLLLSIPRDLWVKNPRTGEMGRINSVYQSGPTELVKAVQNLGIPVHHYVEINFVSFGSIIDALGGIDIEFEHAARDTHSGLFVDNFGVQHLDGQQSLAYVRSRFYEEAIDGQWVTSGLADLDRVKRQQKFLTALVSKMASQKNPAAIGKVISSLGAGLKIDERLGYFEAIGLAWKLRSFNPEPRELIVLGRTTSGGAQVLDLMPASVEVIKEFQ